MKSLRETLVGSHVAAVAVAVLLFFFFQFLVRAFQGVLPIAAYFVATAIAIRGMPYVSLRTSLWNQFGLVPVLYYFLSAALSFAFAELLSRWVYGVSVFSCLKRYRPILGRRNHA